MSVDTTATPILVSSTPTLDNSEPNTTIFSDLTSSSQYFTQKEDMKITPKTVTNGQKMNTENPRTASSNIKPTTTNRPTVTKSGNSLSQRYL